MELKDRARLLLEKVEPSISGSGGHGKLLAAAGALVNGFSLSDSEAESLLLDVFNPRCSQPWSPNEIRHKVSEARKLGSSQGAGYLLKSNGNHSSTNHQQQQPSRRSPQPQRIPKRSAFDPAALAGMMTRGFKPDYKFLAEISPIDPRTATPGDFLNAILEPGERTLVIYQYYSQGQYGFKANTDGGEFVALGNRRSIKPETVDSIESSGREGAWYLPNPIDGTWKPTGKTDRQGNPILSRRLGANTTSYRYLLLESDEAAEDFWLNLISQLPLPIAALYTSGSRSVHALIKVNAESKSEFDAIRETLTPLLSKLGADPGAISGVRLTRLPGVLREGTIDKEGDYIKFPTPRLQRLLYLNPDPAAEPLRTSTRRREVDA